MSLQGGQSPESLRAIEFVLYPDGTGEPCQILNRRDRVRFAHRRLPWHRAEGSRWHQSWWETMVAWREVVVAKMERVEKIIIFKNNLYFLERFQWLRGKNGEFPYAPWPHTCITSFSGMILKLLRGTIGRIW